MAKTIVDRRKDKSTPRFWVVFTDSLMSGWGKAKGGRSLYALACDSYKEAEVVLDNGQHRSEMKRGRIQQSLPWLRDGDHLSCADKACASRWYEPGSFA